MDSKLGRLGVLMVVVIFVVGMLIMIRFVVWMIVRFLVLGSVNENFALARFRYGTLLDAHVSGAVEDGRACRVHQAAPPSTGSCTASREAIIRPSRVS